MFFQLFPSRIDGFLSSFRGSVLRKATAAAPRFNFEFQQFSKFLSVAIIIDPGTILICFVFASIDEIAGAEWSDSRQKSPRQSTSLWKRPSDSLMQHNSRRLREIIQQEPLLKQVTVPFVSNECELVTHGHQMHQVGLTLESGIGSLGPKTQTNPLNPKSIKTGHLGSKLKISCLCRILERKNCFDPPQKTLDEKSLCADLEIVFCSFSKAVIFKSSTMRTGRSFSAHSSLFQRALLFRTESVECNSWIPRHPACFLDCSTCFLQVCCRALLVERR